VLEIYPVRPRALCVKRFGFVLFSLSGSTKGANNTSLEKPPKSLDEKRRRMISGAERKNSREMRSGEDLTYEKLICSPR
jgi:hypothetical protein